MYSAKGYETRAEECVRLANLAVDQMVQADLLKLRQTYLRVASRLQEMDGPHQGARQGEQPSR